MTRRGRTVQEAVFVGGSCRRVDCIPEVTVVIPVYNPGALLQAQLEALAVQDTDVHWELVLADNGTSDGSLDAIGEAANRFAHVHVLDASARRGPSYARNRGARQGQAPLILFCDADDVADSLWVHEMVRALRLSGSCIGGRLCTERLNSLQVRSWRPPLQDTQLPTFYAREYVASSNLGVTRELFESLEGFDESFPSAAFEDVDFSLRAADRGDPPTFWPAAVMHYRLREDLASTLRQAETYGASARLFFQRHADATIVPPTVRDDAVHYFRLAKRFVAGSLGRSTNTGRLQWEWAYSRTQTRALTRDKRYWSLARRFPDEVSMSASVVQRRRYALLLTSLGRRLADDDVVGEDDLVSWESPWGLLARLKQQWSEEDRHLLGAGLLADADVTIEARRGDNTFLLNPSLDGIVVEVIQTGQYGSEERAAVFSRLMETSRGPTDFGHVVNVGANIGTTAIGLAERGYRVVAIEPALRAYELLVRNIEVNELAGRVLPIKAAITQRTAQVELVVGDNLSTSELRGAHAPHDLATASDFGVHVEVVDGRPLATLLTGVGVAASDIALVWSDTEGAEYGVVASGAPLWASGIPLWVEIRPSALRDQSSITAFVELARQHFTTLHTLDDLRGSRAGRPISTLRAFIDELGFDRYAYTNVLLTRA